MRQGLLTVLLAAVVVSVVAGRRGSLDVLSHAPSTLQEKTITAIQSLSHVLSDLQESLAKEGRADIPTEAPPAGIYYSLPVRCRLILILGNATRLIRCIKLPLQIFHKA